MQFDHKILEVVCFFFLPSMTCLKIVLDGPFVMSYLIKPSETIFGCCSVGFGRGWGLREILSSRIVIDTAIMRKDIDKIMTKRLF